MYRRPIDREAAARYRKYVSSHHVSRKAHLVRQMRGRKRLDSAQGRTYDLEACLKISIKGSSMASWPARR